MAWKHIESFKGSHRNYLVTHCEKPSVKDLRILHVGFVPGGFVASADQTAINLRSAPIVRVRRLVYATKA